MLHWKNKSCNNPDFNDVLNKVDKLEILMKRSKMDPEFINIYLVCKK